MSELPVDGVDPPEDEDPLSFFLKVFLNFSLIAMLYCSREDVQLLRMWLLKRYGTENWGMRLLYDCGSLLGTISRSYRMRIETRPSGRNNLKITSWCTGKGSWVSNPQPNRVGLIRKQLIHATSHRMDHTRNGPWTRRNHQRELDRIAPRFASVRKPKSVLSMERRGVQRFCRYTHLEVLRSTLVPSRSVTSPAWQDN